MLQVASLSSAFQPLAIWSASLLLKNSFIIFQYCHLQLQHMVLSHTCYVASACSDCCRNTLEKEVIFYLLLF